MVIMLRSSCTFLSLKHVLDVDTKYIRIETLLLLLQVINRSRSCNLQCKKCNAMQHATMSATATVCNEATPRPGTTPQTLAFTSLSRLKSRSSSCTMWRQNIIIRMLLIISIGFVLMVVISRASGLLSPPYVTEHGQPEPSIVRRLRETNTTIHSRNRSLVMGIQLQRTIYKIPTVMDKNLVDWNDRPANLNANKLGEVPLFWHILKSGGTTVKLMYATCYNFVEACETGMMVEAIAREEEKLKRLKDEEEKLQMQIHQLQSEGGSVDRHQEEIQKSQEIMFANLMQEQQSYQIEDQNNVQRLLQQQGIEIPLRIVDPGDGRKYVNVDVTTPIGIQDAVDRGFASSHLADIIFTPLIVEATKMLLNEETNRGRLFAVFRDPIDRATSTFYYLQKATWEPTYNPIYATWTIHDYANSPRVESNWMVRSLVNKLEGPLDPEDVEVAKEILHKKCLVGLMDRMEESILRFHKYFGFDNERSLQCAFEQYVSKETGSRTEEQNSHSHPQLERKGETYRLLAEKNSFDIVLYEYAVRLFEDQGKWMKDQKIV